MSYRGRFAPSPTGSLHFGSLVAAVGSWLCSRHAGGRWLVRMEDIDPPREVPGSAAGILAALPAFGLVADEPVLFQSQRRLAHDAAFEQLRSDGHLFACWCSRSDLAAAGGMHRDGVCVAPEDPQRPPAWRLRAPDIEISFDDALQGPQRQNLREAVGDFVIRRVDGLYSYQLACVVDDAYQGITEVVRGADLLDSTPRQIHLQRCLGLPTPRYLHLPLVLDAEGLKLSKSSQAVALDPADPMPALRQALAFLGVPADAPAATAAELLAATSMRFNHGRAARATFFHATFFKEIEDMTQRTALVTGGTGGIGTAIIRYLAGQGHRVASNYRDEAKAETWRKAMAAEGIEVCMVPGDVTDPASCEAMIKAIEEKCGPVEILVNNAGITRDTTFHKMNYQQWTDVINTNLNACFNVTRPVIESMRGRKWGRIVQISSINGQKGQYGQANYAAAKAGMHGFTISLAQENAKFGITVNTVSPGYVGTDMVMAVPEEVREKIVAQIPVGRLGKPEEIAHAVAFLTGDMASWITGANLAINGGHYMGW